MSTSYFRLIEPFTRLRLEENPVHDEVSVWESGALAGILTVTHGLGREVVLLFTKYEEDNECPLRSYWGGVGVGAVVYENGEPLPDEAVVVSEYGDILTAKEVRARHGA